MRAQVFLVLVTAALSVRVWAVSACPNEMVLIDDRFCMDRYEAPNEKGSYPFSAWLASEGESWCAAQGKRLCSEDEWVRACEGTSKRKYPYGSSYRQGVCNDAKQWKSPDWNKVAKFPKPAGKAEVERLYQGDPSGSHGECVSEEEVFDLSGNVAEWVVRTRPNRTNYDHVMKGCFWAGCYGGTKPNCSFVNPAHPGSFRSYEVGFRCCVTLVQ